MKKTAILAALLTAVRTLTAASLPVLAGEAYYWNWGQHPAAGYFDHPPMVAFIGKIFFSWVLGSELALRSGALILGALTIFAVYGFARSLFPQGTTAWRSTLLFGITPIFAGLGIVFQPDNALILFMVLTWWLFWRAIEKESNLALWFAAGVVAGLALLSKFHAWVLVPPVWLFLAFSPPHRKLLARPGPWIALTTSLAVLSPNLVWNAQRGWLNYAYQLRRSDITESMFEWENIFHFFAGPFALLSPLVGIIIFWSIWRGIQTYRAGRDPRVLYLLLAGVPLILVLGLLSVGVTISAHWPATGYIPLMILAVFLLESSPKLGAGFQRWMFRTAAAMTVLLHVAPLLLFAIPDDVAYPLLPDLANSNRLKREIVGVREIGDHVRKIRDEMNEEHPTVIMAKNWHLTSMLGFYARLPQEVFALEEYDAHNYQIWMKERGGLEGVNAVVVIKKSKVHYRHQTLVTKYDKYHRFLDPLFERVEPAPSLICYEDGAIEEYYGYDVSRPRLREFLIFRCYGFKGELAE